MDAASSSSSKHMQTPDISGKGNSAKVVVATTIALTFISFWRAAAIVLNDMASTMFYIGGITEQAIGKPAPWLVMAGVVFCFAGRSLFLEKWGQVLPGGGLFVGGGWN